MQENRDHYTNLAIVNHPTIHDLPTDERPRERLQNHGPQALSNAELLAIILRTGTTRNNVIELAGILLAKFGGLGGLMRADFMELCKEYGLGAAKAAQLKAALEMGRRLGLTQLDEKYQIKSPADAANLVMMEMAFLDHEQMCVQVPVPISTFNTGDLAPHRVAYLSRAMVGGCRWQIL
jgi:DNA repair protein RadC